MNKYYYIIAILVLVLVGGGVAYANPSFFAPGVTTVTSNSTATTTISYMTPGTATTTTNVYDAYSGGVNTKPTDAVLLVQFTASSTTSVLGIALEYSQDGIDWYQNNLGNFGGLNIASTTNSVNNTISIVNTQDFSWRFASTTVGGAAVTGSINRVNKIISVPMPTRYVRAVFSCTGANCAVYGQLVPNKEQSY